MKKDDPSGTGPARAAGAASPSGGGAARRFFADPECFRDGGVVLDPEESRHLTRVLRLGQGHRVEVCDGCGRVVEARVERVAPEGVVLTLERELEPVVESPLYLTLAVGLAKTEALETVIRQATEMGVRRIEPFLSAFSARPASARLAQRLERWRRLARESLKSCQRAFLPEIAPAAPFARILEGPEEVKLLCWEEERVGGLSLSLCGPRPHGVRVVVGPEGGFPPEEAAMAQEQGFRLVSLGPRRLKVETAALTIIVLIQHAWGDLA